MLTNVCGADEGGGEAAPILMGSTCKTGACSCGAIGNDGGVCDCEEDGGEGGLFN